MRLFLLGLSLSTVLLAALLALGFVQSVRDTTSRLFFMGLSLAMALLAATLLLIPLPASPPGTCKILQEGQ
jgi:Na+/melibiose symporter-like transporter